MFSSQSPVQHRWTFSGRPDTASVTRYPFAVAVIIMTVVLSPSDVDTQRTFQRQCDCEYMVDGRCAYTLLLPALSSSSSPMTCPASPSSDSSSATQINYLQGNVSELRSASGVQANAILGVQSTVAELQSTVAGLRSSVDRLQLLLNASSMAMSGNSTAPACQPSTSCGNDSSTSDLAAQRSRIDAIQTAVNQLNRTVEILVASCAQGRCGGSSSNVTDGKVDVPPSSSSTSSPTSPPVAAVDVGSMERQLRQKYWLCSARGLLVSGRNRSLPDDAISVSNHPNESSSGVRARIESTGWCPDNVTDANRSNWLQFDLGNMSSVFAVVTRGRQGSGDWVTSYRLEYAVDYAVTPGAANVTWTPYNDVIGNVEIFVGNRDAESLQVNALWQPIAARLVRIFPLDSHGVACLRADVIGCLDDK